MCRTKTSLDLSARVTVKKKTPPSTYARRYRDMAAREYHLSLCVAARRMRTDAWARRARARLCPPYTGGPRDPRE
jgi:hypothetical protein